MNELLRIIKLIVKRKSNIDDWIDNFLSDTISKIEEEVFPEGEEVDSDEEDDDNSMNKKSVRKTINEWREYVENKKSLLVESNEKLIPIDIDGNCEFSAISMFVYKTQDAHRVRRELVNYLLEKTFGNDSSKKYLENHISFYNHINDILISKRPPNPILPEIPYMPDKPLRPKIPKKLDELVNYKHELTKYKENLDKYKKDVKNYNKKYSEYIDQLDSIQESYKKEFSEFIDKIKHNIPPIIDNGHIRDLWSANVDGILGILSPLLNSPLNIKGVIRELFQKLQANIIKLIYVFTILIMIVKKDL